MTDEQLSAVILDVWEAGSFGEGEQILKQAINAAILEEREACAKIANDVEQDAAHCIADPDRDTSEDEYYRGRGLAAARIAQKIRARK
jgi:hypothetical protein